MIWTMIILPIVLMAMGMPIYTVLMASASLALIYVLDLPIGLIQTELFGSVDNYNLIAVPFFILAGAIMSAGGISERLVNWVLALFGGVRGSLGLTTVGACTVFSAISGSSAATVAAIGRMMFPALRARGYPESTASGLLAASGAIDAVIPPSIAMILYGVAAEESIRYLFIGGILPGFLMAGLMALYIYVTARRLGIREGGKFSAANVLKTTRAGGWALGMPVVILGGIYTGVFSPTEAAGVACLYAIVIALYIHRDLDWTGLWRVTIESVVLTAQVLIIVAAAALFARLLTIAGVPQSIAAWIASLQLSSYMVLLAINLLLLAVGCVIDPASAILVLAPILKPIVVQAGIDPIHFGVIMTVNLSIGMFTPPFGLNIFIIQGMFKVPLPILYRGLVPVIGVNLVALLIISMWPGLTLWLVKLIG